MWIDFLSEPNKIVAGRLDGSNHITIYMNCVTIKMLTYATVTFTTYIENHNLNIHFSIHIAKLYSNWHLFDLVPLALFMSYPIQRLFKDCPKDLFAAREWIT